MRSLVLRSTGRAVQPQLGHLSCMHAPKLASAGMWKRSVAAATTTTVLDAQPNPTMMTYTESEKPLSDQELSKGMKLRGVQEVRVLQEGAVLAVTFRHEPETEYHFQSQWLMDSCPEASFNASTVRSRVTHVLKLGTTAIGLQDATVDTADSLNVQMTFAYADMPAETWTANSDWLQAFAPFVAKPVPTQTATMNSAKMQQTTVRKTIPGEEFLIDKLVYSQRKRWGGDFTAQRYDYNELSSKGVFDNKDMCVDIIEKVMTEGVVMIDNMPPTKDFSQDQVGKPLIELAEMVVGRMYQHPRRRTQTGFMRKTMATADAASHLTDYNMDSNLNMHTDHAFIGGSDVAANIQWMVQAQGSVITRVCNSYAVAETLREEDPAAFELLASTPITHSLRTFHYAVDGSYTHNPDPHHDGIFEDCATHPIIELTAEGHIRKIAHQEIKRGICAIPYEKQEAFLNAYQKFSRMCESPEFCAPVEWPVNTAFVVNNHYVLHGRGFPYIPGEKERVMVWGYSQKHIVDMRYRLLKQWVLEDRYGIPQNSLTNLPNQVLHQMMENLGELGH